MMNLDWDRLRVLDALARTGTVTRAAVHLHMTGPAVSQQLRRIEAETHTRIVEPKGRGVRLTPEGRILADYARRMSDLMQEAENRLQSTASTTSTVRVVALASLLRTHLGEAMSRFTKDHPHIEILVTDGETHRHLEDLERGAIDLVVAESWSTSPLQLPGNLRATSIMRDDCVLVGPGGGSIGGGPLVGEAGPTIEGSERAVWVTCERDSHPHRALVQFARGHGIEPDIRFFVADHTTQLSIVTSMNAIALLPSTAEVRAHSGIVTGPPLPGLHREILLLTNDRTLPTAVANLVEALSRLED